MKENKFSLKKMKLLTWSTKRKKLMRLLKNLSAALFAGLKTKNKKPTMSTLKSSKT